jgi:hypothetical protein
MVRDVRGLRCVPCAPASFLLPMLLLPTAHDDEIENGQPGKIAAAIRTITTANQLLMRRFVLLP